MKKETQKYLLMNIQKKKKSMKTTNLKEKGTAKEIQEPASNIYIKDKIITIRFSYFRMWLIYSL